MQKTKETYDYFKNAFAKAADFSLPIAYSIEAIMTPDHGTASGYSMAPSKSAMGWLTLPWTAALTLVTLPWALIKMAGLSVGAAVAIPAAAAQDVLNKLTPSADNIQANPEAKVENKNNETTKQIFKQIEEVSGKQIKEISVANNNNLTIQPLNSVNPSNSSFPIFFHSPSSKLDNEVNENKEEASDDFAIAQRI